MSERPYTSGTSVRLKSITISSSTLQSQFPTILAAATFLEYGPVADSAQRVVDSARRVAGSAAISTGLFP